MHIFFSATFLLFFTNIFGQLTEPRLKITPLTSDFYIYTTYNTYEGNKVPAHGMYVVTSSGVVLFDTPWDSTQFQPLLDSIQHRHQQNVSICLVTHWHSDRTDGLEYYRKKGIKTYSTKLTDSISEQHHKKRAEFIMPNDTVFNQGQHRFETFFPGPGHTEDNLVVWFPREKILYGGCLIKGAEAEDLGFVGDGNVREYAQSLINVQKKYPQPNYIIVSHHDWDNINSLKHSVRMAKKLKRKSRR